jgi:hypothetical protein
MASVRSECDAKLAEAQSALESAKEEAAVALQGHTAEAAATAEALSRAASSHGDAAADALEAAVKAQQAELADAMRAKELELQSQSEAASATAWQQGAQAAEEQGAADLAAAAAAAAEVLERKETEHAAALGEARQKYKEYKEKVKETKAKAKEAIEQNAADLAAMHQQCQQQLQEAEARAKEAEEEARSARDSARAREQAEAGQEQGGGDAAAEEQPSAAADPGPAVAAEPATDRRELARLVARASELESVGERHDVRLAEAQAAVSLQVGRDAAAEQTERVRAEYEAKLGAAEAAAARATAAAQAAGEELAAAKAEHEAKLAEAQAEAPAAEGAAGAAAAAGAAGAAEQGDDEALAKARASNGELQKKLAAVVQRYNQLQQHTKRLIEEKKQAIAAPPTQAGGAGVGAGGGAGAAEGQQGQEAGEASSKVVTVEGRKYHVVWSCLLLLDIVIQYLTCASFFPMIGRDVLQRVVELLRFFNMRSQKLLLGAAAMSVVGLRNITAKHLALCSQCLSLVMIELPHVRAALATHLPKKQHLLLTELDRVGQDYQEHNEQLLSKFVGMISDMMERQCATLEGINWDAPAATSKQISQISNGTVTLHKVLHQVLPPEQLQEVFSRVFDLFCRKLPGYFTKVAPQTDAGNKRIMSGLQALVSQLQALNGVDGLQLPASQLLDQFSRFSTG